jgi:hypothetical protein
MESDEYCALQLRLRLAQLTDEVQAATDKRDALADVMHELGIDA